MWTQWLMRLGIRGCHDLGERTWVLKGVDPGVDEARNTGVS